MIAPAPRPSWWHVTDADVPVRFRFRCSAFKGHPAKMWECRLAEQKCESAWCATRVRIAPCCAHHLWQLYSLAIRPSTVASAGWGLFAHAVHPCAAVFRKGVTICQYAGEILTKGQLDDRYGEFTAPYAAGVGPAGGAIDAACSRSVGSMANHASGAGANAAITEINDTTLVLIALRDIADGEEVFVDYIGDQREGDGYSFVEPGASHETVSAAIDAADVADAADAADDDDDDVVMFLFSQGPGVNSAENPIVVPGGGKRPRRRGRKTSSRRRRRSKTRSKSRK